jgi:hypothetical protein
MHRRGFVLITALTMLVVLMALLTAYFTLTRVEISTTASTANATTGFYAAEAGLNLRAEAVKGMFTGGPPAASGTLPTLAECVTNVGGGASNSFGCWRAGNIQGRAVDTSLRPADAGTTSGTGTAGQVAPGEAFAGLRYTEFNYDLSAQATLRDQPEAILGMRFRVRQIPLFQFMAFYDEDLELGPGPQMTLNGPVHTNGDLYLSASNGNTGSPVTLDITGQVTAVGNLVRGRKNGDSEQSGTPCPGLVRIRPSGSASADPSSFPSLLPSAGSGGSCPYQLATNFSAFNGSVRAGNATEGLRVNRLSVPRPETLDPTAGATYWDNAQLRLVLDPTTNNLQVQNTQGQNIPAATTALLTTCSGIVGSNGETLPAAQTGGAARGTANFYNAREATAIRMLDVDMTNLLGCVNANPAAFGFNLSAAGGLVFYFTVCSGLDCRNAPPVPNNYGVRVRNGANISSPPNPPSVNISGLSVVSNQAVYVQGDFNCKSYDAATRRCNRQFSGGVLQEGPSTNTWRPAAFLSDSLNVLSNRWESDTQTRNVGNTLVNDPCKTANASQQACVDGVSTLPVDGAVAQDSTINAAFLSGVDVTAGGAYNGGLQNYPRFHENWAGRTLTYKGSFVSLDRPRYVRGGFPAQRYNPPNRVWEYDTAFNDSSNLPPLTPKVTQLEQELFSREFEQGR